MGMVKELVTDTFEGIYGLDLDNKGRDMVVCKSIPLLDLPKNPMTMLEMKIFDVYLGRIHPQNPDVTKITFEKRELEELFGVDKINSGILTKALKNLMTRLVTVYDGPKQVMFTLLSTAELVFIDRKHTKIRALTLECSEKARKYIYNLGSIRYLKLSLARLVSFDSRHAYSLYQYLNANLYRRDWNEDLHDLKAILGVNGKYSDYTDFDRRVLKVALDEINTKTEMRFTYEPVLKYNKTYKIHFHISHTDAEIENKVDEELKQQEQEQVKPNINVEHDTSWLDGKITLGLYDESDEQLAF